MDVITYSKLQNLTNKLDDDFVKNTEYNTLKRDIIAEQTQLLTEDKTIKGSINEILNSVNNNVSSIINVEKNINDLFLVKDELRNLINTSIAKISNGTPLVANSKEGMHDTNRIYVNTTDGNWYYHNGNDWISGGVYQATELQDNSISANKTDFIEFKDLKFINQFNFNECEHEGFYRSSDGTFIKATSTNNYGSTKPISYTPNTPITCWHIGGHLTFWDENLNFIEGQITNDISYTIKDNPRIKYFRLTIDNNMSEESKKKIRIYTYSPSRLIKLKNNDLYNSLDITDYKIVKDDILPDVEFNYDWYVSKTGVLSNPKVDDKYYGCYIIPIDYPQTVEIWNDGYITVMDKNLHAIKGYGPFYKQSLVLNEGEKYIAVTYSYNPETKGRNLKSGYVKMAHFARSINNAYFDSDHIVYNNQLLTKIINDLRDITNPKLANKKWDALGDSITEGPNYLGYKSYVYYIGTKYNMDYINKGVSGAMVSEKNESSIVEKVKTCRPNADIISVACSTNDFGNSVTLGTFDSRELNTFYGALHYVCKYLVENYLDSIKVFTTPVKRENNNPTNRNGNTLEDFANAIKEVCKFYGIPVIDLFTECQINPYNQDFKDLYIPDGLHPNDSAHKKFIMPLIVDGFNRLF